MGRYWTKAERKQHVRRKRQQQQQSPQQMEQVKTQPKQSYAHAHPHPHPHPHAHQLQAGEDKEDAGRRPYNVPVSTKMTRKKSNVDDFTTVQELLAQGSRAGAGAAVSAAATSKMLGLLSVTTV